MNVALVQISRALKAWAGSRMEPVVLMMADVKTAGIRTDLGDALQALKYFR